MPSTAPIDASKLELLSQKNAPSKSHTSSYPHPVLNGGVEGSRPVGEGAAAVNGASKESEPSTSAHTVNERAADSVDGDVDRDGLLEVVVESIVLMEILKKKECGLDLKNVAPVKEVGPIYLI